MRQSNHERKQKMTAESYLEACLAYYQSTFDLKRDFEYGGMIYDAYGHFYAHNEKYVLAKEVQMWETNCYEHVFFQIVDELTPDRITQMGRMVSNQAEPELVCRGKKYPPRNHMYSYLTCIFLCRKPLSREAQKAIRSYHFSRTYLFSVRGWCEARTAAVSLTESRICTNRQGSILAEILKKPFYG